MKQQLMRIALNILIILVAVTVLSAWTFRLDMDTIYRGADASNMIEEFQAYGLSKTTMYIVGIFKVLFAILLLTGLRYKKLITPSAVVIGSFMLAAIYFHLSINDPLVPTFPSSLMFISCVLIVYFDNKLKQLSS